MKGIMLAVILFVALAVIGAMAAPKTNRGTTGTNGSSGTGGTVANPVAKIGDAVTVGSWNVTVEKIETSTGFDWSGFKNMQEPKGIYVFVYATATNNSTKTDSVNSFDYKIVDGTGATFDSCNELGCFGYPNKLDRDSFNTQVPPRTATKLLGIFDVAPHSKNLTLVIERNTKIAIGNTP
ncbi:MAG: DUF4352 domain-containing protein [Chloroflexota bacterium]